MMVPVRSTSRMVTVGRIAGMSMCRIRWNLVAPSIVAASYSSGLIPERAAR